MIKRKLSDLHDGSDTSSKRRLGEAVVDNLTDGKITCQAEAADFERRQELEDSAYLFTGQAECTRFDEILAGSPEAVVPNEQLTAFLECPKNNDEATNPLPTNGFDTDSLVKFKSADESARKKFDWPSATYSTDAIYVHEELDHSASQIRLLRLEPASTKEADIFCSLELASIDSILHERLPYEALSYTWGDQQEKCTIHVNGRLFQVTFNLDFALRHLREPSKSRILWIDAICIDQSSLKEKTHQVQRMAEIYRNASLVIVWLGESDMDICKIMGLFNRLEHPIRTRAGNPKFLHGLLNVLRHPEWRRGLQKIFAKSWWSRMWVVQEVAVAKRPPLVGCGHEWASWLVFQTALLYLAEDEHLSKSGILLNSRAAIEFGSLMDRTGMLKSIHRESQPKHRDLRSLLLATSDRDSSHPHDKIFALLGLAEQNGLNDLTPDYSQPCRVVYQKAMVHVLTSAPDLNFIIESMNQKRLDVPSWCVDFSQPSWNSYTHTLELSTADRKKIISASAKVCKGPIIHNCQEGTLEVTGCIVGIIEHIAAPVRAKLEFMKQTTSERIASLTLSEIDEIFLEVCMQVSETGEKLSSQTVHNAQDLFGKAVQNTQNDYGKAGHNAQAQKFNKLWQSLNGNNPPKIHRYVSSFIQAVAPHLTSTSRLDTAGHFPTHKDDIANTEIMTELKARAFNSGVELVDQTLFTTDTGHLGKAPTAINAIEKGDAICILHGCYLPAVLRPIDQRYKVVTFAYVSEVMCGDFFNGGERESQRIILC